MNRVNNNDQVPDGLYAEYANSFDLSLLPMDNEIDLLSNLERTQNEFEKNSNQFMNPIRNTFTPPLSPEYIPLSVYEATNKQQLQHQQQQQLKEQNWSTPLIVEDSSFLNEQKPQIYSNTIIQQQQQSENLFNTFPPSPTPTIDFNRNKLNNIKQENPNYLGVHQYPLSPPDSNGAPSPIGHHYICDFKTEPIDTNYTETSVDINIFFQNNSFDLATNTLTPSTSPVLTNQSHDGNVYLPVPTSSLTPPSELIEVKRDHQLLREYLQDTTFQKKHNLKPLALETLFVGDWTSRDDIEPMISLALEHAKKDVQQTCNTLDISADPEKWNNKQVQSWIMFTMKQFKLPSTENIERLFNENGVQLSRLTENDFINRIPQAGATLFAQLEIWKAACCESQQCTNYIEQQNNLMPTMDEEMCNGQTSWNQQQQQSMDCETIDKFKCETKYDDNVDTLTTNNLDADNNVDKILITTEQQQSIDQTQLKQEDQSTDNEQIQTNDINDINTTTIQITPTPPTPIIKNNNGVQKTGRHGSAHIHLWQFLKELLQSPQTHGTTVRWLDQTKGVFKIEDSVRVARLWGRRKNRPAMNYDKLSRSIRQYYKKGIMKKTERSQRLVYQFCHPYGM